MLSERRHFNDFVEAYEEALDRDGSAHPADFLPPPGHPLRAAVLRELLRIDLERRHDAGEPASLDEYRQRFPEAFADPEGVRQLAFEDYRLRLLAGQVPDRAEYARHFGVSLPPLTRTADRSLVRAAPALPFPVVGTTVEGFRLVAELGRGAFGRVYLAEQDGLAGRRVVVKVARDLVGESQMLAQLQHPHIVPLYSVHPLGALQLVCMPRLGTVTLADALERIRTLPAHPARASALFDLAGQAARAKLGPAAQAVAVPASLLGRSYTEAVLWLGARLADGLAHAHERGILHRDLKPANVLLTDDGLPMLLDFNLSEDTKLTRSRDDASIGGTLPYMAPEQIEAFLGRAGVLDGRADVFALGAVLFEMLTGRLPHPVPAGPVSSALEGLLRARRAGPPDPRGFCPCLPRGVAAVVRRCLEPDLRNRYCDARALQEDLDCQLAHLPLRHTPEPSLRERSGKWLRRHARLTSVAGLACAALVLVALLGGLVLARGRQLARYEAAERWQEFCREVPGVQTSAGSARVADPVHLALCRSSCDELLARYDLPHGPSWQKHPEVLLLGRTERERLQATLGELLLLSARLTALQAGAQGDERQALLQDALKRNLLAGECLGLESLPVLLQRSGLLAALGRVEESEQLARLGRELQPQSALEKALLADVLLAESRAEEARALLEEAVRTAPEDYRLWFSLGLCQEQLGDDMGAVASFTTCGALVPSATPVWFKSGSGRLRLRQFREAVADFDRVCPTRPDLHEARINRALAWLGLGKPRRALADLDFALERGSPYTRVWLLRAEVKDLLGDHEGARRDRATGLAQTPQDELSWVARASAWLPEAPQEALADLRSALALNPRSLPALQNTAYVLTEHLGRPAEAVEALDQLLRHHPRDLTARASRGVLLARLGRDQQARADARACPLPDARPEVLYRTACVFALTSRRRPEDRAEALARLAGAVGSGYGLDLLDRDPDLDPVRDDPLFRQLRRQGQESGDRSQGSARREPQSKDRP